MRVEPFKSWLEERLSISTLGYAAQKKEVPLHRQSIWYYFGGMTLFLFVVQVVTGILLLLYYRPSAENAFESVQFIMTEVKFGWLIRSIHSWSANLMILTLFIHMLSVYFMRAYDRPREVTWVSGVVLLLLSVCFGFSGYLLPWNEVSFFATKVGTEIAGVVPVVGKTMLRFLRGGDDVTGATLTRFFGFHVAVLPALATVFIAVHVLLVQLHGMHVPARYQQNYRRMKFFPNFLMRDLIGWLLAIGVLAALAAIFPWELGVKADPFVPAPAGIKPEWYFLFMFQTLKYIPPKILIFDGEVIGILLFMLAGAALFFIPFVNRSPEQHPRRRLVFNILGAVALLFMVVMTVIGYLA
jgi:quinol-cytochrome oxidoreductase complex cytochrome b subunit